MEERTKTVTRRLGWKKLKRREYLLAVEKCMGLKKGEKHIEICTIKVISTRPQPLSLKYITQEECNKEGFPELTPQQFIDMFCKHNRCKPEDCVNRIEFYFVNLVQRCGLCQYMIFTDGCGYEYNSIECLKKARLVRTGKT
jgi:hypothetical protein